MDLSERQNMVGRQYIAIALSSSGMWAALEAYYRQNIEYLDSLLYDILLFCPEVSDPVEYTPLIKLAREDKRYTTSADVENRMTTQDHLVVAKLEELVGMEYSRIDSTMRGINLRSLTLTQFLDERVRRIGLSTGLLGHQDRLLRDFPEELSQWRTGILRPLSISQKCGINESLQTMENLDVAHAIKLSIGSSSDNDDLEQVLDDALLPWARYRQVVGPLCSGISSGMANSVDINLHKILRILSTFMQSDLNSAEKDVIAAGAMLACYKKPLWADGRDHTAERQTIVAILRNTYRDRLQETPELDSFLVSSFDDFIAAMQDAQSKLHFFMQPCSSSIELLHELVEASALFGSIEKAVMLRFAEAPEQERELGHLLRLTSSTSKIETLRHRFLEQNFLGKLSPEQIEILTLRCLLLRGDLVTARRIYITAAPRPLQALRVERIVIEVSEELFDNAKSIGRRDLGPVAQVLGILHPKHTNEELRKRQLMVDSLIELSAYKGAQVHLPVQIKQFQSNDLLDLFSRILQQPDNYKKHVRLLGLYQNLCLAMAIIVREEEFYELVTNAALSFDELEAALKIAEDRADACTPGDRHAQEDDGEVCHTDSIWRLLYQVSRYPCDNARVIQKQLQLLSKAAALCPKDSIYQMVALVRRLESSLQTLQDPYDKYAMNQAATVQEDNSVPYASLVSSTDDDASLSNLAEDLSTMSRTTKIEMPQWRLFEAAQSATRTAREFLPRTSQEGQTRDSRVRKRDQIVDIVGTGVGAMESRFTSGLGWICKL